MDNEPTLEQKVIELHKLGWRSMTPMIWKSPSGKLFLGPNGAWKLIQKLRETNEGTNL